MAEEVKKDVIPGKGKAIASMVLGIVGVVFWFTSAGAIVSIIVGIIGIVLASKSKKEGFEGGIRTAGFVLSIISVAGGGVVFLACSACVGALGTAGLLGSIH